MTGEDWRSVVERIHGGDPEAFDALYRAFANDVYRFCRKWHDEQAAEDLMSIVFLEAWRGRAKIRNVDGRPRAWLFGIARNVVRNASRSMRRHEAALARYRTWQSTESAPDPFDEAEADLNRAFDRARVTDALGRLTEQERTVVRLSVFESQSIANVARVLNEPLGTVKARRARAISRLRRLLQTSELLGHRETSGHGSSAHQTGALGTRG